LNATTHLVARDRVDKRSGSNAGSAQGATHLIEEAIQHGKTR
jgi:hypothetical protein